MCEWKYAASVCNPFSSIYVHSIRLSLHNNFSFILPSIDEDQQKLSGLESLMETTKQLLVSSQYTYY